MNTLKISRFDSSIPKIEPVSISKVNYSRYVVDNIKFQPFSVNSEFLKINDEITSLSEIKQFDDNTLYVTLTIREKKILLKYGLSLPKKLIVIERDFPFLKEIKYRTNISANYNYLVSTIRYIKSVGLKLVPFHTQASKTISKKLLSKVRLKNNLDDIFYFCSHKGFQEVFVSLEKRKSREIVCFDFNSMYLSCMEQPFPSPCSLTIETYEPNIKYSETLRDGLYRVKLSSPKTCFIKKYHYFRYVSQLKSSAFNFEDNLEIEVMLLKEEMDYLNSHFNDITILESILFLNKSVHPLLNFAKNKYNKRKKHRNNPNLDSLNKLWVSHASSAASGCTNVYNTFESIHDLKSFLTSEYHFNSDNSDNYISFLSNIDSSKKFKIKRNDDGKFTLKSPDYKSKNTIHIYTSIIISRARLKLLKLLDEICLVKSSTICYVNIDSVHVSIDKSMTKRLLDTLKDKINDNIGGIKIEARGNIGIWLDIGRYWIFDDNGTVKSKNSFYNNKNEGFVDRCQIYYMNNERSLKGIRTHRLENKKSISAIQIINSCDFYSYKRFGYKELTKNSNNYIKLIEEEIFQSTTRLELINIIKSQYLKNSQIDILNREIDT
ncbi:hypothetical protein ACSTAT_003589 [Vibrio cholerae]